jgi:hypothetical protein
VGCLVVRRDGVRILGMYGVGYEMRCGMLGWRCT